MLDLCGRHGGTSGNALHIFGDYKSADTCDVVKEICQQVDEDAIYSMDFLEEKMKVTRFLLNVRKFLSLLFPILQKKVLKI